MTTAPKIRMWFAPEDSCYTSPVRLSMMVDSGYGELRGDPPDEIELITGEYVKPYKTYIYKLVEEQKKVMELFKELEWSGYSWAIMTQACPSCFNAKKDGHKENCKLAEAIRRGV